MRLSVIVSVSPPAAATVPSPCCLVCRWVAIASPLGPVSLVTCNSRTAGPRGGVSGRVGGREHRAGRRLGAQARRAGVVRGPRAPLRPALRRCSASARTRGGAGRWWRPCRPARPTACSTSPPAPGWWRGSWCAATGARSSASTRAARCSPGRGAALARRARAGGADRAGRGRGRAAAVRATREFDHLTFTYLLRYVDDPRGHARRARPRGQARAAGSRRSSSAFPTRRFGGRSGGSTPAPGCRRSAAAVRRRLVRGRAASSGRASRACIASWPLERQLELWESSRDRRVFALRRMSLGGGVVIWGSRGMADVADRPAFYALRPGGWRDLVTILHPPYTAWHLSYVAFGAAAAPDAPPGAPVGGAGRLLPRRRGRRARAGRAQRAPASDPALRPGPRRPGRDRRSPGRSAIGVAGVFVVSATLAPFVVVGAFLVARLQPRAVRRPLPHRLLVRRRMGLLPGPDQLLGELARHRLGRRGGGRRRA